MTKNIFVYFCILLICQLSYYRLTLPDKLKNERFLLIVDGYKSHENILAPLLLYLFNIDLLILPSHSSHLLQPLDIAVTSPLKVYFKDDLILENCDLYLQGQDLTKQSARQLRCSLISAFLNAMRKSCTIKNIVSGFKSSGICPLNSDVPISSDYAIVHSSNSNLNCDTEDLLENHWFNSENSLGELFLKENGFQISEEDYNIELKKIVQDIKASSLNSGLSLSDLPPLFIEDDECIHKVN